MNTAKFTNADHELQQFHRLITECTPQVLFPGETTNDGSCTLSMQDSNKDYESTVHVRPEQVIVTRYKTVFTESRCARQLPAVTGWRVRVRERVWGDNALL